MQRRELIDSSENCNKFVALFMEAVLCIYLFLHFSHLICVFRYLPLKIRILLMRKRCWESWWFMSALLC